MRDCSAGKKKFASRVRGCDGRFKCVRYGDRSMTIKKHIPARKKSFCARHRCKQKTDPATPGYQSCKKWACKTGKRCASKKTPARKAKKPKTRPSTRRTTRKK